MTIRLRIDELVLDGLRLDPGQGAVVKAAAEAELARLLSEDGLASGFGAGGAWAHARGGAFRSDAKDTPEVLGRKIGRAVHGGMRP